MSNERILEDVVTFKGHKVRVIDRTIDLGDGQVVHWEVIDKGWNSVALVPVDDRGNVTLVEEYFGATNERALCLAKGKIDEGETPQEAAAREMREEIQLSGDLSLLAMLSLSPGYLTQRTYIYLAQDLRPADGVGDEVQYIAPVTMPLEEAIDRCRGGSISEARTVAGLLLAKLELDFRS